MLKNYFRIAFRNLVKHKGFSFINIFGLALGTACCLYILLYVKDEYSYDQHHEDADRIYRITSVLGKIDDQIQMATCSPPIPGTMKRELPEVQEATRFVGRFTSSQTIFRIGDKVFYETDGAYADSTFFDIFTYPFIYGDPENALAEPFNIVLSEATAKKFFGDIDPVGKSLEMDSGDGRQRFNVTGVFGKDLGKSHIQANYFLSMDSGGIGSFAMSSQDWSGNNFTNAYVKLSPNATVAGLQAKLPKFLDRHAGDLLREQNVHKELILQPLTDIHTNTSYTAEPSKPVSSTLLFILLGIAGLIQLIACINFMNLSTARAAKRAKEIGIRKVVGAQRQTIIGQFLSESILFAFLAMLVAVPAVNALLPFLNRITGVTLSSDLLHSPQVWLGILLLGLLTGLLAGSYPAFYLSGFRPLRVLKNETERLGGHVNLRQGLVVFQFVLAISLIISVIVINAQLKFIQQQDLGYDPEQKIVVPFRTTDALGQLTNYRDAVRRLPEVKSVSIANNYPSQFVFNDIGMFKKGASIRESEVTKFMRVDEYFVQTLGMELLHGRDFKVTDTTGALIANEALLRALDIPPSEAAGRFLSYQANNQNYDLEIVGVIRDFNFNPLYDEVTPFMLIYDNRPSNSQMIIDAETDDYTGLLSQLENTWESRVASVPFEYSFIDEAVQQQYEADRRLSGIINAFTFLTILISCLGLLGLATFTAERRTKEIGIRKVLGATVLGITTMISKEFLKLVLIAILLSIPLAWWAMRQWLENFAYSVDIQWWMFVVAGVLAMVIAAITVSFQSLRAAMASPVHSLKDE